MTAKRLSERVEAPFKASRVTGTPEAPVIEGVLACGPVSANRRRYLKEAFAGDKVQRYVGKPVKVTPKHGEANGLYAEQIGVVQKAYHREDGMPLIDIAVNPHKPLAQAFLWDAKNQPKACGMSHVADCKTRAASDGWDEVVEMVEAVSVDVIGANGAATTKGLFEGKTGMSLFVKALCEALVKHPKITAKQAVPLKALAEMDGMDAAPVAMDAPPADDAEPGDGVSEAFVAAILSVVKQAKSMGGDMDDKAAFTKIKKLMASHGEVNGDAPAEPDDSSDDDDKAKESKKPDFFALLKEARAEVGPEFNPTETMLKALAALDAAEDRKALLAEHKAAIAAKPEKPKSGAPKNPNTVEDKKAVPVDGKIFAESIRS